MVNIKAFIGIGLSFILASCANISDREQAQAEGALVGCGIGSIIGNLLGKDTKSTIAGCVAGGIAGAAYGDHVASKKASYADQESYLNDVIAAANVVTKDAEAYNQRISVQIKQLESQEKVLSQAIAEQKTLKRELKTFETELTLAKTETEKQLQRVNNEIEIQNRVITSEKETASPKLMTVAASGVSDLEIQQRALTQALAQLENIDSRRAY